MQDVGERISLLTMHVGHGGRYGDHVRSCRISKCVKCRLAYAGSLPPVPLTMLAQHLSDATLTPSDWISTPCLIPFLNGEN